MKGAYTIYKVNDVPMVEQIITNPFGRIVYFKENDNEQFQKWYGKKTYIGIHTWEVVKIQELTEEELVLELL